MKKENEKTSQHECKLNDQKKINMTKYGKEVLNIVIAVTRIIVVGRLIAQNRNFGKRTILIPKRNLVQSVGSRALHRQCPARAPRARRAHRSLCSLRTSVVRSRVRGGV